MYVVVAAFDALVLLTDEAMLMVAVIAEVRGCLLLFFFSSRRRHTRCLSDWSSDVCSSDLSRRPSDCVAFLYLQPNAFSQRLAALRAAVGSTPAAGEGTMLEKMRCITGSMQFENGKIHDVLRSEERRVGKECRLRWSAYPQQ